MYIETHVTQHACPHDPVIIRICFIQMFKVSSERTANVQCAKTTRANLVQRASFTPGVDSFACVHLENMECTASMASTVITCYRQSKWRNFDRIHTRNRNDIILGIFISKIRLRNMRRNDYNIFCNLNMNNNWINVSIREININTIIVIQWQESLPSIFIIGNFNNLFYVPTKI